MNINNAIQFNFKCKSNVSKMSMLYQQTKDTISDLNLFSVYEHKSLVRE